MSINDEQTVRDIYIEVKETSDGVRRELWQSSGWCIAAGVLMIILGLVAITQPLFATLAVELLFGWVLLVSSIVQFFYAFQTRKAGQVVLKLLLSVLYLIGGILLLSKPLVGILTLTLVLGINIFVVSVVQVIMAFQMRPASNWGWVLFSGVSGIILGILIWSQWPFNAPWVVGLLVGISLFFDGLWIIMFSAASSRIALQEL